MLRNMREMQAGTCTRSLSTNDEKTRSGSSPCDTERLFLGIKHFLTQRLICRQFEASHLAGIQRDSQTTASSPHRRLLRREIKAVTERRRRVAASVGILEAVGG